MTEETWKSADVAERAGIPYGTLMHWVEEGLLTPRKAATNRQKPPLLWGAKEVREACVLAHLRAHGLPLQTVRKVMDYLRSLGHNPLSTGEFLCIGRATEAGAFVKVCSSGEVLDLIRRGQLVLPLDRLEE